MFIVSYFLFAYEYSSMKPVYESYDATGVVEMVRTVCPHSSRDGLFVLPSVHFPLGTGHWQCILIKSIFFAYCNGFVKQLTSAC